MQFSFFIESGSTGYDISLHPVADVQITERSSVFVLWLLNLFFIILVRALIYALISVYDCGCVILCVYTTQSICEINRSYQVRTFCIFCPTAKLCLKVLSQFKIPIWNLHDVS